MNPPSLLTAFLALTADWLPLFPQARSGRRALRQSLSALLLAALQAFGPGRTPACAALPAWRRQAKRPSCLDLITLRRKEMVDHPQGLAPLNLHLTDRHLTAAAAA